MLVQRYNNVLSVYVEEGEDVGDIYRMPDITEIIRYNNDGTTYTHLRMTINPVICQFFDLNFMRITYRKCHIWFLKQEVRKKTRIACGEFPIPIDEMQYTADQVTYKLFAR